MADAAEPRYRLTVAILRAATAEGLGDMAMARTGLERALDIEARVHDGSQQALLARANLLNRLGRCLLSLEEFEATVATLEDVVSICDGLGGENAPPAVVNLSAAARNRLGRAHKALGNLAAAESYLGASVAMMREIARGRPVADVIEDLATALRDLGEVLLARGAAEEGGRLIAESESLIAPPTN